MSGLTRCQWMALQATADGLTSREIARLLGRHPETVRDHLSAAYRALGARNAAHAVAIALRAGYITPPGPGPGDATPGGAPGSRRDRAAHHARREEDPCPT